MAAKILRTTLEIEQSILAGLSEEELANARFTAKIAPQF